MEINATVPQLWIDMRVSVQLRRAQLFEHLRCWGRHCIILTEH